MIPPTRMYCTVLVCTSTSTSTSTTRVLMKGILGTHEQPSWTGTLIGRMYHTVHYSTPSTSCFFFSNFQISKKRKRSHRG